LPKQPHFEFDPSEIVIDKTAVKNNMREMRTWLKKTVLKFISKENPTKVSRNGMIMLIKGTKLSLIKASL
jgi:hypothetical protein